MLKLLKIINFKSYREATFKFDPGVNVIIGEGLSGKSNVLRAIELIRTYRPANHWRRKKADKDKPTTIELETTEGKKIKLIRSGNPKFIVKDINTGEAKTYRKFNRNIPDDIEKALSLKDLNVQGQFDSQYLVFDTPSAITREINKITNISIVDNWLSRIKESRKEKEIELLQSKKQLRKIRAELKSLKVIRQINPLVKELNKLHKERLPGIEDKIESIQESVSEIKKSNKIIEDNNKVLKAERFVKRISRLEINLEEIAESKEEIKSYIENKHKLNYSREVYKTLVKEYFKILSKQKQCPLCFSHIDKISIERLKNEYIDDI